MKIDFDGRTDELNVDSRKALFTNAPEKIFKQRKGKNLFIYILLFDRGVVFYFKHFAQRIAFFLSLFNLCSTAALVNV